MSPEVRQSPSLIAICGAANGAAEEHQPAVILTGADDLSRMPRKGRAVKGDEHQSSDVETPISAAVARLIDTQTNIEELLEWRLFRALSLLLVLQPGRSSGHPGNSERLEQTVTRTDAELDKFAQAAHALYRLGRITVRNDAPVLYPAAGFFPLVARQTDGHFGAGK